MNRRFNKALPVIGVACITGLVACSVSDAPDNPEFPDRQDVGGGASNDGYTDIDGEAVEVPDMSGVWLHYQEISTCVDFGPVPFEQLTSYLYVVEVEQDVRNMIRETWQACDTTLSAVLGMESMINPAMLTTSFPVVTGGHAVAGTSEGSPYHSGPVPEVWGIAFDDPVLDPFPGSLDDPRFRDTDRDGNPGVTLLFPAIQNCEAHIANRTINNHHGEYVAPDRIEGTINSNTQQLTLGSTGELCGRQYLTRDNQPRNRFARQRVDGRGGAPDLRDADGAVSCDAAVAAFSAFFERRPVDDVSCRL